jgi:hypothetical protein
MTHRVITGTPIPVIRPEKSFPDISALGGKIFTRTENEFGYTKLDLENQDSILLIFLI